MKDNISPNDMVDSVIDTNLEDEDNYMDYTLVQVSSIYLLLSLWCTHVITNAFHSHSIM